MERYMSLCRYACQAYQCLPPVCMRCALCLLIIALFQPTQPRSLTLVKHASELAAACASQGLPRPFKQLRELDMEALANKVAADLK